MNFFARIFISRFDALFLFLSVFLARNFVFSRYLGSRLSSEDFHVSLLKSRGSAAFPARRVLRTRCTTIHVTLSPQATCRDPLLPSFAAVMPYSATANMTLPVAINYFFEWELTLFEFDYRWILRESILASALSLSRDEFYRVRRVVSRVVVSLLDIPHEFFYISLFVS